MGVTGRYVGLHDWDFNEMLISFAYFFHTWLAVSRLLQTSFSGLFFNVNLTLSPQLSHVQNDEQLNG